MDTDDLSDLEAENERLKRENKRLRERLTSGPTRRRLIRAAGVAGAGALSLSAATGSAAAAPSGTFPDSGSDPLLKTRLDRLRYIARTSAPAAPSSGRVIAYIDDGDLP